MNAERMHAVARRLLDDIVETRISDLMDELHNALVNAANAPQDAHWQNEVSSLRLQVESALDASQVSQMAPLEVQVLEEWGITDTVGPGLRNVVDQAFTANQITLATARDEIGELAERLRDLRGRLTGLSDALQWFNIGAEELGEGEFEIDILVPRQAVRSELGALGQELQRLQEILLPFVELASGSRPAIEVRTVGSSDFTLFLIAAPAVAACIADAVTRVLDVYLRIMQIRHVKAQIEELNLPDGGDAAEASALPLETYASTAMSESVEEIAATLVSEYAHENLPDGRSHELQIEVRRSLLALADRIDDRYNIAVRTGPVPELGEESDAEDGSEAPGGNENLRFATEVLERGRQMQFVNLTGSPILGLSTNDADRDDED